MTRREAMTADHSGRMRGHVGRTRCLAVTMALLCLGAGCTKKPINTGATSTTAVRKSFEGTWKLLSLNVAAEDGRQASVDAQGELIMDAFANLKIEYRVTDAGLKSLASVGITSPNPVISTTGQVLIDGVQQRVTYVGEDQANRAFDPALVARRNNPFALERVRYYSIGTDGLLTLSTRYDNGRNAATSKWERIAIPPPIPTKENSK